MVDFPDFSLTLPVFFWLKKNLGLFQVALLITVCQLQYNKLIECWNMIYLKSSIIACFHTDMNEIKWTLSNNQLTSWCLCSSVAFCMRYSCSLTSSLALSTCRSCSHSILHCWTITSNCLTSSFTSDSQLIIMPDLGNLMCCKNSLCYVLKPNHMKNTINRYILYHWFCNK